MRQSSAIAAIRRLRWGVSDQVFSSGTNFALGIAVARTVSLAEFGAFSIAFATYSVSFGLVRALTSDVLAVRFSRTSDHWREGTAYATGTALVVGGIIGLLCMVSGALLRGSLAVVLLTLGPAMPGLMLQDTWRFAFFARDRGLAALLNDVAWAIVMFPLLVVLVVTGRTSIGWLMIVWEGSALVAALVGMWQAHVVPRPSMTRTWLREHRDFIGPFMGEFAALRGSSQIVTYAVAAIGGLVAAGAMRGAMMLLNPLNIFFLGFKNVVVPEGVRLLERSASALRSRTAVLSLILGAGGFAWGGILLLLPDHVGVALLGRTWVAARALLLPATIAMATSGMDTGPAAGVRAVGAVRRSFRTRVVVAVVTVIACVVGVELGGASGATWGLAITTAAGALIWWIQFDRALEEHEVTRRNGVPVAT
jgi:O-antigen/teichoic acid export membrane protein